MKLSRNYGKNARGKTYPEQSTRQIMRGQRRAQGGPGITEGVPFPILREAALAPSAALS